MAAIEVIMVVNAREDEQAEGVVCFWGENKGQQEA
jgi:hypothetical protein